MRINAQSVNDKVLAVYPAVYQDKIASMRSTGDLRPVGCSAVPVPTWLSDSGFCTYQHRCWITQNFMNFFSAVL